MQTAYTATGGTPPPSATDAAEIAESPPTIGSVAMIL
jgi:hypothetical protein